MPAKGEGNRTAFGPAVLKPCVIQVYVGHALTKSMAKHVKTHKLRNLTSFKWPWMCNAYGQISECTKSSLINARERLLILQPLIRTNFGHKQSLVLTKGPWLGHPFATVLNFWAVIISTELQIQITVAFACICCISCIWTPFYLMRALKARSSLIVGFQIQRSYNHSFQLKYICSI
jgi:hypothetical protein